MTPTTQTPLGDRRPPTSSPGGLIRGAATPFVPPPRVGTAPTGAVDDVSPVPAGGTTCPTLGCVAGMMRFSFVMFRGAPLRSLLVDDPACGGTGLDLANYAPGGATALSCPVVPLGLPSAGAR